MKSSVFVCVLASCMHGTQTHRWMCTGMQSTHLRGAIWGMSSACDSTKWLIALLSYLREHSRTIFCKKEKQTKYSLAKQTTISLSLSPSVIHTHFLTALRCTTSRLLPFVSCTVKIKVGVLVLQVTSAAVQAPDSQDSLPDFVVVANINHKSNVLPDLSPCYKSKYSSRN